MAMGAACPVIRRRLLGLPQEASSGLHRAVVGHRALNRSIQVRLTLRHVAGVKGLEGVREHDPTTMLNKVPWQRPLLSLGILGGPVLGPMPMCAVFRNT